MVSLVIHFTLPPCFEVGKQYKTGKRFGLVQKATHTRIYSAVIVNAY